MDSYEYVQHWQYFCSLAKLFDDTKIYTYHGLKLDNETNELIFEQGNVFSDRFKQIILLAASEFELIAKSLAGFNGTDKVNISDISRIILEKYPKIIDFELITPFAMCKPLDGWRMNNGQVKGLEWWSSYNVLKHNNENSYKQATLENAFSALAALYIVNLYLMHVLYGDLRLSNSHPCIYFKSKYLPEYVFVGEGELPDFGNTSPFERIQRNYPELFSNQMTNKH